DSVIATKFPAYCVRHPNKVAWVLHQFRQAYDYDGTDLGQFSDSPKDRATRRAIERLDAVALGEARRVFATSRNVAERLLRFNGRVDDDRLADLYARCLAVYYAPVDEDFGMVPFEAFLSGKPVLTTTDAGGPLEVVHDRETGLVVAPDPRELAQACTYLGEHV